MGCARELLARLPACLHVQGLRSRSDLSSLLRSAPLQTAAVMADSSFFSSPTPSATATPLPATPAANATAALASSATPTPVHAAGSSVYGASSLLGIGGGQQMLAPPATAMGGRPTFDPSAGTPMVGALSFTPALSHTMGAGAGTASVQRGGRSSLQPAQLHHNASFFATPAPQQQQQHHHQLLPPQANRFAKTHSLAAGHGASPAATPATPQGTGTAAAAAAFSTTPSVLVPLDFPLARTGSSFGRFGREEEAKTSATAPGATKAFTLPDFRPHANKPLGTAGSAAAGPRVPLPLSAYANGLPSTTAAQATAAKLQLASVLGDDSVFGTGTATGTAVPAAANTPVRIRRTPLRALVRSCLARGHLGGAIFYADKLATLEQFSPSSVLQLAQAYARDGQHQRAVHLLRKHKLLQLPSCNMAEWRRQTVAHEAVLLKRAAARSARKARSGGRSNAAAADAGKLANHDDDADPEELDPVTVRMECLYQGLQSLLEMQAHEDALRDCLPPSNTSAYAGSTVVGDPSDDAASAVHWESMLTHTLAAMAPVQPATTSALGSLDAEQHVAETAATVREVIGADETALVLTLLKYRALRRERERHVREQGTVKQEPAMSDSFAQQDDDDDEQEDDEDGRPIDVSQMHSLRDDEDVL
jgi:hypothetical protein